MKILVANLGSTSLKYRLFEFEGTEEKLLTRGGFERVTEYPAAIDACLDELKAGGFIQNQQDLAAVGFKPVVARGVTGCVRMDEKVLQAMEDYSPMAPAHNPPYITGVRIEGVRRWGFHGASHKFMAERSAELLARPDIANRVRNLYVTKTPAPVAGANLRVVSCHLGGSSSLTAILNGVGICNSLGMTPQAGLPQNNRVGDLDSFAIPFMMRRQNLSTDEVERQLCKESGLKGLSGGFNDMRDIRAQALGNNPHAQLAIDVFVWQARHWLGAYYLEMNGLDGLVFTAGIAENNPWLREQICRNLDHLGIKIDPIKNNQAIGIEALISTDDSQVKIYVIPTNEELVVAREVKRFLENH